MLFTSNDCKVEVFSDDERFKGSYHRAILEEIPKEPGHQKLKVRYLTLLNEDGSAPLTKVVDQSFIRPLPPEERNNGVFEGSVVDAYLKHGWWTGVVIKTMEVEKYLVYFDSPPDIIQFERKQLRVHLDWTGYNWVRPDHKELIKSDFGPGTVVELRANYPWIAWIPVIIVKELENEKRFIVKYFNDSFKCSGISKIETVDSLRVRPTQPSFSVGKYDLLDHVEVYHGSEWLQGLVRGIIFEGRYMVSFGKTKAASQFNHSDFRPSMEWKDGVWHKRAKPKRQRETPLPGKRNKSVSEEHNIKCYTRKRKKGEPEHNSDLNKTASARTPNAKVLPFTKRSPFWKTYESMEVFKRLPQSPHFSPLFETREDFREGFALCMIVTYSGLLEKLKDLETDVPISQLDSLKDSFSELEKHGFDVTRPLSRIDKLLERKDRQLSILEELKGLNKGMTDQSSKSRKAKQEFDEAEQKILEVKHKILELQRQEAALKERKEAAKEQKDAIYKKICHVKSCARDLDIELQDVESEFETILSAPW